jgi:hypothetical protein
MAEEGVLFFEELAAAEPDAFSGRRDAAAATLAQRRPETRH